VAELSRPRRQFKEDERRGNKPSGRKRQHEKERAERVNWFSPFLWTGIERAAFVAGKPWSPRQIRIEAQRQDPKSYATLTDQVVGRWIDREAEAEGVWKWRDSILRKVEKGNAPGGQSTRAGILVSIKPPRRRFDR
jgi:hypothetical protein